MVGAARMHDNGGLALDELAEHVAAAMESGGWVKLGFYLDGWPESMEFWPTMLATGEGDALQSMKIFTGGLMFDCITDRKTMYTRPHPRFAGCLIISQGDDGTEAVLIAGSNR